MIRLRQKSRFGDEDWFIAIPDKFEKLRGIQRQRKTCNLSERKRTRLFYLSRLGALR
jgi:hypothetical protein